MLRCFSLSGCAFVTFTARQMAQSAIKSMHQSQTMEVNFNFTLKTICNVVKLWPWFQNWWIIVSPLLKYYEEKAFNAAELFQIVSIIWQALKLQFNDVLISISTSSCHSKKHFLCPCLGLFIAYCGEVCRHSEGQGAETHGPTTAAANAATQCCFHVGKSHWSQQPGATVPSSECVCLCKM